MSTRPEAPDGDVAIPIVRTGDSLDAESFRRIGRMVGSLPWGAFRADFQAIGARNEPWPRDDAVGPIVTEAGLAAYHEAVVFLTIGRLDQPAGFVVPVDLLVEQLWDLEVVDAIVLPMEQRGDAWVALLSPSLWVEVGSNLWLLPGPDQA